MLSFLTPLLFISFVFSSEEIQWVQVDDMFVPAESLTERGLHESKARLWKNGIIPLKFDGKLTMDQQEEFLNLCNEMGEFADVGCRIKNRKDRDYVQVLLSNANSCGSSHVGRKGGRQDLKIRCWRPRTIQHELMHAFGLAHEHNRFDRDDHIVIQWENLKFFSRFSYTKINLNNTGKYLKNYDFKSIMHYDSRSGSKNGKMVFYRKSLGPKNGYVKQSNVMSRGDHYILYALYGGSRP